MQKIITLILFFFCFNILLFSAEIKPKLSMSVFANETACWTCLQSIKNISNVKLTNYQLEIKMFFCSENDELIERLIKQYDLNFKKILDPECLYGKKYNFSSLPAIVVEDVERDSIIIKEHWNNPREYLNKIIDYDNNYKPLIKTTDSALNFTKSMLVKKKTTLQ